LAEQKDFAGWNENHPITAIIDDLLTKEDPDYKSKPGIKWNFTKFLINKKGQVVARYESTEDFSKIKAKIEELLK
jgi:glutathione peroxidase